MSILSNILRFFIGTVERPSPSDIVPVTSLGSYYGDGMLLLNINLTKIAIPFTKPPLVWWPSIPDTNSMDPVLDIGHNALYLAGVDEAEQTIMRHWLRQQPPGNVVAYRIPEDWNKPAKIYAVHRIIKLGTDKDGPYYVLKGDNNATSDPYKVRDFHVTHVCIGVIY